MDVIIGPAALFVRESLHQENSPKKIKQMAKNYFITFGLLLQKANFDPKKLEKNHPHHVFFKMTGSAISGLAVTMVQLILRLRP